ncbi:EAL domain-containing protein [Psychromonas sp. MME2]|uniref:putative bifunctional diguanylate cyclase/phosphodiesterase n=1 Tax=unclassified Psychromonas TaxID=2614957 RepID=UPI00339D1606
MKLNKKIKYIILPVLTLLSIFLSTIFYIANKQYIIDNEIASLNAHIDQLLLRSEYKFKYTKDYLRQKIESKEATLILNSVENKQEIPHTYIAQFLELFLNNDLSSTHSLNIINDFSIYKKNNELVVHINTEDPFAEPVLKTQTKQILYSARSDKQLSQYYYFTEMSHNDADIKFYMVQIFSPYQLISTTRYNVDDSLYLMQTVLNTDYLTDELNTIENDYQGFFSYKLTTEKAIIDTLSFSTKNFTQHNKGSYQGSFATPLFNFTLTLDKNYFSQTLNVLILTIVIVNIFILIIIYLLLMLLINKQIIKPITSLAEAIKGIENVHEIDLKPLHSKDEVADLNASYISLMHKINTLANYDSLTGLLNRSSFNKELNTLLANQPNQDCLTALFYIDLDNFKYVNDNFGHEVGDKLLNVFSLRLSKTLRIATRDHSVSKTIIARFGGDEFVVVITELPSIAVIKSIGKRICGLFIDGFTIGEDNFDVHASIGISYSSTHNQSPKVLLNQADVAMYIAKKEGKNKFTLYSQAIQERIQFEKNIEASLVESLIEKNFLLLFMPAFSTGSLKLEGYELLIRCPMLEKLKIGPDTFITIAEKSDLILKIDLWVVEQALKMLSEIIRDYAFKGFFSINVSSKSLRDDYFYNYLKKLIKTYDVNVKQLEIELTETCLLPNDKKAIASLTQLKSLGIRIALDDFGTGYTSFSQLVNYPLDTLKIDRSFVQALNHDNRDGKKPTLNIIFELAKAYELDVIVEGIETEADFNYVQKLGCDSAQGYYFTKPMSWDAMLAKHHKLQDV